MAGKARHGKDTAVEALVSLGFLRTAFADPVRAGLLAVNPNIDVTALLTWAPVRVRREIIPLVEAVKRFGWEKLKSLPEVRGLLQRYGTEGGREIHGFDCWTAVAGDLLDRFPTTRFAFSDVRFVNEVDFIHEFGGLVYYVERPGFDAVGTTHISEQLDKSMCDEVIINDKSVRHLQDCVISVAKSCV